MVRIRVQILLAFISIMFLFSCSEEVGGDMETNENQMDESEVPVIIPTGNERYLNEKSVYIFDQDKLPTFELNLPIDHLREINDDPTAEEYVEGSLTFEGETMSPVGIRYKGSIGAFVGCVSGSDWTNPSGRKTCTKLSMKVRMNWQDKDDKFYGLKKLQFHSQNLDDSQMRDRLGYHLFREMGVPAPRCVHARLVINGVFSGVYALVEQIDGRFTRQNFEDGKGNLYKEIWPLYANGNVPSDGAFEDALETNEDEDPTFEMIKSFAEEIKNAPEDSLKAVVSRWMDIDEIISYAVVDRMIRVDDGPCHWYCDNSSPNSCSPHNFYWFEENTKGTMHLIPWDLDNAFENIVFNRNPVTPIADEWGESRNGCDPFSFGTFGLRQRSAACDKLIYAWTLFEEEYEQKQAEFISGPFSKAATDALIDKWAEQIRESTQEAEQLYDDAVSISQWEGEISSMKSSLDFARAN